MAAKLSFDRLRSILVGTVTQLPDYRTRPNTIYGSRMRLWAPLPSSSCSRRRFWPTTRHAAEHGHNNAQSLFGIDQVPSHPHIRNLLDPIAPEHFAAPSSRVFEHLRDGDYLSAYQGHFGEWLLAVDGTEYFSSQKIHCPQCTVRVVNERTHYSHTLVAPLLVAPNQTRVIAWNRSSCGRGWRRETRL